MQTSFGSAFEIDQTARKQAEHRLLEALRVAVAGISIKELAYALNLSPSLLADALAERSSKGVRASWLITIIEMANEAHAIEVLNAIAAKRALEVVKRRTLTPEEKAERLEEKLRTLGPVGMQLIREAIGEAA
jgi:AraC-like DNA-binding protein